MFKIFKVLGDENRLRILNILFNKELCVCEIEALLDMTQSNVSRHLAKLKSIGIISSYKHALWVHYKINNEFCINNKDLIAYIKEEFTKGKVFTVDTDNLQNYITSGLNCSDIREDIETVRMKVNVRRIIDSDKENEC